MNATAEYFRSCSEHFGQLAAILRAIKEDPEVSPHVKALADAGHYIATDLENTADCWRQEIQEEMNTNVPAGNTQPSSGGKA